VKLKEVLLQASPQIAVQFPFTLSLEQAIQLLDYTPEEWERHAKDVRANHPCNSVEIDAFLGLPLATIIASFKAELLFLLSPS
jgi:hypothetical protein